jgi:hypothetical protein
VTTKSLKAQNVPWIWTVVVADALAVAAFASPSVLDQAATWLTSGAKLAGGAIAPVVVLLLTSLIPADVKAILVYWRVKDVLPGSRAFSRYARRDERVDVDALKAKIGQFPRSGKDQNSLWYRLFKERDNEPEVSQAHRLFLLFRDLAALSVLLSVVAPVVLLALGAGLTNAATATAVFGVQYLACAVAARSHGVRMVCNVLALHAAARPPASSAGRKKDPVRRAGNRT